MKNEKISNRRCTSLLEYFMSSLWSSSINLVAERLLWTIVFSHFFSVSWNTWLWVRISHQLVRVSLFSFPFGFTKILMISSSDPAACVFANKCGKVCKSVQSFKDTLLFHDLRHQTVLWTWKSRWKEKNRRMQLSVVEKIIHSLHLTQFEMKVMSKITFAPK